MTPATLPRLSADYDPSAWARHTAVSDPGPHRAALVAAGAGLTELCTASRNLIVHYRASGLDLPAHTREDPNARWVSAILGLDQERHGDMPLAVEREATRRVQGCCRDHSLVVVAGLREQGRPARLRYGFAEYLYPGYGTDHAIVEAWDAEGRRWQRCDPEFGEPIPGLANPWDQPVGPGAPYQTAAEVWLAYRDGAVDPLRYGVAPGLPFCGPWFLQTAVVRDAAFRGRHEVLLWDGWEGMSGADGPSEEEAALADDVARLTVAADGGGEAAEAHLLDLVATDPRLAPPAVVATMTPWRDEPGASDLSRPPHTVAL